jgi:hypothetical protein
MFCAIESFLILIDFKNKTHRPGKHDDYVSKNTNLNYIPLEFYKQNNKKEIRGIAEVIR